MADVTQVVLDSLAQATTAISNRYQEESQKNNKLQAQAVLADTGYRVARELELMQFQSTPEESADQFVEKVRGAQAGIIDSAMQQLSPQVRQFAASGMQELAASNIRNARTWKVTADRRRALNEYAQAKADLTAYAKSSIADLATLIERNEALDQALVEAIPRLAAEAESSAYKSTATAPLLEAYVLGLLQHEEFERAESVMQTLLSETGKQAFGLDDATVSRLATSFESLIDAQMKKWDSAAASSGDAARKFLLENGYDSAAEHAELLDLQARGSKEASKQLERLQALEDWNTGVLVAPTPLLEDMIADQTLSPDMRSALLNEVARREESLARDPYIFAQSRNILTEADIARLDSPDYEKNLPEMLSTQLELYDRISSVYLDDNISFLSNSQLNTMREMWQNMSRTDRVDFASALREGVGGRMGVYGKQLSTIDPLLASLVGMAPIAELSDAKQAIVQGAANLAAGIKLSDDQRTSVQRAATEITGQLGETAYSGWEEELNATLEAIAVSGINKQTKFTVKELIKYAYNAGVVAMRNGIASPEYKTLTPAGSDKSDFQRYIRKGEMKDYERAFVRTGGEGKLVLRAADGSTREVTVEDIHTFGQFRWHAPNAYMVLINTPDASASQFVADEQGNIAMFYVDKSAVDTVARRHAPVGTQRGEDQSDTLSLWGM
jgi:hypothetical protein